MQPLLKRKLNDMQNEKTIGVRLREERERLKLNQADFAELAGVTRNTQSLYETDERTPDGKYLNAISFREVDILYVLCGNKADNTGVTPRDRELLDNYHASASDVQEGVRKLLELTGKAVERADALSVIAKVKVAQQKAKK